MIFMAAVRIDGVYRGSVYVDGELQVTFTGYESLARTLRQCWQHTVDNWHQYSVMGHA